MYARLLVAIKDMEPELVCIDSNGKSSGYGVLRGGFMIHTSTSLARKYVNVTIIIVVLCVGLLLHILLEEFYVNMNNRLRSFQCLLPCCII